jgi:hypothetical protein
MPKDGANDCAFLETGRSYLTERRVLAKEMMELSNAMSDLKSYIRIQAKLAAIDVLLSVETEKAVQRVLLTKLSGPHGDSSLVVKRERVAGSISSARRCPAKLRGITIDDGKDIEHCRRR